MTSDMSEIEMKRRNWDGKQGNQTIQKSSGCKQRGNSNSCFPCFK